MTDKDRDPGAVIIEANPNDWREHQALRLEALRREPSAFGSTHRKAILRPDAFWIERLAGAPSIDPIAAVAGRSVGMVSASLSRFSFPIIAVMGRTWPDIAADVPSSSLILSS